MKHHPVSVDACALVLTQLARAASREAAAGGGRAGYLGAILHAFVPAQPAKVVAPRLRTRRPRARRRDFDLASPVGAALVAESRR